MSLALHHSRCVTYLITWTNSVLFTMLFLNSISDFYLLDMYMCKEIYNNSIIHIIPKILLFSQSTVRTVFSTKTMPLQSY